MTSVGQLERRIIIISVVFAMTLFGLAALAVNLYHVGLPTCLTDIKPFQKGELIAHSPTHYELHYVARMWKFEPEDVTVPAGSTVDIYLSTRDVTHGLILLGTDLNLMAVPAAAFRAQPSEPTAPKPVDPVSQLLDAKDCLTCHSIDGQESIGPTLKGIYGRKEKMADGSTITADDAYLREAIVDPDAKIVNGFDGVMPKPELTKKEVDEIIEYLKTLK